MGVQSTAFFEQRLPLSAIPPRTAQDYDRNPKIISAREHLLYVHLNFYTENNEVISRLLGGGLSLPCSNDRGDGCGRSFISKFRCISSCREVIEDGCMFRAPHDVRLWNQN